MKYIAFDTETDLIAPGRRAPKLVCMTTCIKGERPEIFDQGTAGFKFEAMLQDPDLVIVAHNAQFDLAVMQQNYPWLANDIWAALEKGKFRCTKLNRVLHAIADGTYQILTKTNKLRLDLASLVMKALAEKVEGKSGDTWRFKYRELIGTSLDQWPKEAIEYAKKDAWYTIRVFHEFGMEEPLPDELAQVKYAFVLELMFSHGIITDQERVEALESYLVKRTLKWGKKLAALGLCTWLPKEGRFKDNKKPQQALMVKKCRAAGMPVPMTDPTEKMIAKGQTEGNVQLKKELLLDLPCEGEVKCDPKEHLVCSNPLHWVAAISEDKGELSKYVEWLKLGTKEVVNARVSTCIATGRTAVAKPPWQQLPRRPGVRECVVPRPGNVLIGADYKANELVTLAQMWLWMFGRSVLADMINKGVDPHAHMGAQLMEIDLIGFLMRLKAGDKEVKHWRQVAKAANFGLPGGLGFRTFCEYAKSNYGVVISEELAKQIKKTWLRTFPEARKYFEVISSQLESAGGSMRMAQPVSGRLRGGLGYTDGCNTGFQGLAADMTKNALWLVSRECYTKGRWMDYGTQDENGNDILVVSYYPDYPDSELLGCRPVLFMHDEIILEAPEQIASRAADRLSYLMETSSQIYCPDVKGVAEPWMSRRWYKEAETVRDAQGVLQIWEP